MGRHLSADAGHELEITLPVIDFVADLSFSDLPHAVSHECTRAFVNAVGCIVGGARHALTETAVAALLEFSGPPVATLAGRAGKADILTAALLNGVSAAAYSFDDTYGDAMLHPSGPLIAALLALAERTPVCGRDFLVAYAAGLEVACRLTKALTVAPASGELAWSQTGIVGGMAVALASGKLLRLDRPALEWALGIAASEASGTRATHGSMAASLIFGHAAQTGLRAAILASRGFDATPRPIEHRLGFAKVFAKEAHPAAIVDGLGETFELMANTYKPFPCGLVIHPAVDGVLRLRKAHGFDPQTIKRIAINASPAALSFANRPDPKNDLEAKVSLQHWVAVAAATGRAGIAEGRSEVVGDPRMQALRRIVIAIEDPALSNVSALVRIEFKNGSAVETRVDHCVGSPQQPMTDDALMAKCREQSELTLGAGAAESLANLSWRLDCLPDVGDVARMMG